MHPNQSAAMRQRILRHPHPIDAGRILQAVDTTQVSQMLILDQGPLLCESADRMSYEREPQAPRHPAIKGGLTTHSWRFAPGKPKRIGPMPHNLTGTGGWNNLRETDGLAGWSGKSHDTAYRSCQVIELE